jgi:hypothetical protein
MAIDLAYFADHGTTGSQEANVSEVCIANISPWERRKRLIFAIQQFIVTLVVLGIMIVLGLNPVWRLLLFLLFSAATVSYFQALDKT